MVEVWEALLVLLAATSAVWVGAQLLACYLRRAKFVRMVNKLPGPPAYPIFGCCLEFMGLPKHRVEQSAELAQCSPVGSPCRGKLGDCQDGCTGHTTLVITHVNKMIKHLATLLGMLEAFLERNKKYAPIFRGWVGPMPVVYISDPEYLEIAQGFLLRRRIKESLGLAYSLSPSAKRAHFRQLKVLLSSPKHLEKGYLYRLLHPWLGTGLLTSSGDKWRRHRKLITPAFHFSILHNFVEVFAERSEVLVHRLQRHADGTPFDVFPLVARCALGIICETAMGTKINAQDEKDSEYVTALYGVSEELAYRTVRPWLHLDCVYFRLPCGKRMKKHLAVIHGFAWKIIAEKKSKLAANATAEQLGQETFDGKKRAAFLDLLLQASSKEVMTDEELREEVDTFMFEGYDTTTVAITWSLFLLGLHPDAQARVAEEQHAIFAGSERTASMQDLHDMQYLGQVIKEALRLYPSVHSISRRAACDLQFGQYTVPAGCTVSALIYNTHRNERHFPDPDKFNPENFSAERVRARHPYAYVPFSAGPRNCIGQKFAMLEEKMVLSAVLRRYELRSLEPEQGRLVAGEMILRPAAGVQLALTPRVWASTP